MQPNKLSIPLLALITLGACYPAARGGDYALAPRVQQVTTTRPEVVRMRYGTQWAAHDSVRIDSRVDMAVGGALVVWTLMNPGWLSHLNAWPVDHRTGMLRAVVPGQDRLYYPLVRVVRPLPECTSFKAPSLPVRVVGWCRAADLEWDASHLHY